MDKTKVRILKSHYQSRWALLRRNQKNIQKILLIDDLIVVKNLLSGNTLCHNCLGDIYNGIVENLSLDITDKKYQNIVLINNTEFKYRTLDQIAEYITDLAKRALLPKGRLIISFEHRFLIYNRVELGINDLLKSWASNLDNFSMVKHVSLLGKASPGYGDYFFCFDYHG
jgi:hypothetical protein